MKRILYLMVCLSVLAWTMQACSDDNKSETPPTPEEPAITFPTGSDTQPVFTTEGGTSALTFTATEAWTASVGEADTRAIDWLTVSPTSGQAGTATLTITTEPNNTYDERNAAITLTSGGTRKTLTVTQKQRDALTVTSNKVELEATGGDFAIELQANVSVSYEIEESAKAWLTPASDTRALTTTTLHFQAAANEDLQPRQGIITLNGGNGLTEDITVYQLGSGPVLVLTQDEYLVGSDGETIKVELKSNNTYQIEMPSVDWITKADTRALSTYTHYFTVAPNDTYDAREAVIRFVDEENGLEQTLTIQQMQRDAIVVAQSIYEIGAEGGALDFTVQANVDFTVSTNADWITQVETRGLTERILYFDVAPNEGEEMREAAITLESGSATQIIKVQQFGKTEEPFIELSLQEYKIGNAGGTFQIDVRTNIEYQVMMPDESWIIETTSDGSTHFFEVLLNETYDARTAEIRFVNTEKGIEKTVTVTQEALYDILIEQSSYEIGAEGGVLDLPVQANMDFEVTTSEDWITQINARSLTEQVLHFNVEENTQVEERTAIITISSPNVTHEIQVVQRGKAPTLKIISAPQELDNKEQEFVIVTESEVEYWDVSQDAYWLQLRDIFTEESEGTYITTYKFNAESNASSDVRSGQITFSIYYNGYSVREVVTILQGGDVSVKPGIDDMPTEEW